MPVNLAKVELKLLVVFDALFAERSVTRAAQRLAMSQPAVSNALNRLRDLLNDQLFIRTGEGMQPTPAAAELAVRVNTALRQLERALEPPTFPAQDTDWTFNLAVSDHASIVMLPLLVQHLKDSAPRVNLQVQSKRNMAVPALLDSGEIDLAVGIIPDLPRRFSRTDLFSDRYVCMMRAGHPLAGRPLTLADFRAVEHMAIKPGSDEVSRADRILDRHGVRRRTVITVHQFLAAPTIVARSDLVVLVFERMAGLFSKEDFYFCLPPVADMAVTVSAVWSHTRTTLAAHRWLRQQLIAACRGLTEPPVASERKLSIPAAGWSAASDRR